MDNFCYLFILAHGGFLRTRFHRKTITEVYYDMNKGVAVSEKRYFYFLIFLSVFFIHSQHAAFSSGKMADPDLEFVSVRFPRGKKQTLKKKDVLSAIEELSSPVLHEVCGYLAPLDVLRLSRTSRGIFFAITPRFWQISLKKNQYARWDSSSPAIRVVFAYSYFSDGKIEAAAHLGLPKARQLIAEKKSKEKTSKKRMPSLITVLSSFSLVCPFIPFTMNPRR